MNTRLLTSATTLLCLALPAQGAPLSGLAALDCMIQPNQVVQVGSPAAGVIESLLVERGDVVQLGQPVVQLNATVERAALAVARERALQNGDSVVATSSSELARRELMRGEELHARQFVSKTYLDKLRAEAGVAEGRNDQAREKKTLASREADLAAAQLAQRTVRAPISGVVLERLMSPGEFVDQKPMLRLAAIDPLRVDVLVPASAFGTVDVGMVAAVVPELLNRKAHTATVKTVDRVIDAASNTFRVRLELPNPGNALPAGLRCKVDLARLTAPQPPGAPPAPGEALQRAATASPAQPLRDEKAATRRNTANAATPGRPVGAVVTNGRP